LLIIKLVFIFIVLIVTVIAGIIPAKWKRCRNNEKALGLANTFSGGVFLAIAFVHIIPETASLYYEYKYDQDDNSSVSNSTN
jgi:membrane protein CcdC involved in cytochrome C biogenesis